MNNLKTMLSSEDMTWETPQDFFNQLNKEFNFNLDPCATPETAKCKRFFTSEIDGLKQDWGGAIIFCNPPYGREIKKWVKKCSEEGKKKNTVVVMLIPARTDTAYFHDYIYHKAEIRFIRGRLKFKGKQAGSGSAPFPSMIVIFKNI
jgi:site-specific DNA-methyltransferase (adenine-specific)